MTGGMTLDSTASAAASAQKEAAMRQINEHRS
jgi:hypothetical protein